MPDYRRWYVAGGTYFFTAVTHMRSPILDGLMARKCLHEAMEIVRIKRPMELVAFVLSARAYPYGVDAASGRRGLSNALEADQRGVHAAAYLTRGGTEVPPSLCASARASGVFGSGDTGNTLCATRKT